MTKILIDEAAVRQALEALDSCDFTYTGNSVYQQFDRHLVDQAITALHQTLDDAEQPAPAQRCKYGNEPASCTSSPMDCQCAIDATLEE